MKMYELWFRMAYKPLINNQTLTAALRPGNRIWPNAKGIDIGKKVKIRVIQKPGDDERIIGAILDSFESEVKILELSIKKIKELTSKDFIGMSPDCQSIQSALYHLGLIYNRIFSEEDKVTIIKWTYLLFKN